MGIYIQSFMSQTAACEDFQFSVAFLDMVQLTLLRKLWMIAALASAISLCSCRTPTSNSPIIGKYIAAECIPFSVHPIVYPHTREWDYTMVLSNGVNTRIQGAQSVGGRITVSYGPQREFVVAANPGDYIYPSDVRMNRRDEILYVKAQGPAGGLAVETWLFEYNLKTRTILGRVQITNNILPEECLENSGRPLPR